MNNKNPATREKKDLKHVDMEKFGSNKSGAYSPDNSEYSRKEKRSKDKQAVRKESGAGKGRTRKISLAVDIIVAIGIILIIAGLIVGAYFAFRYYSDIRYKDVYVKYTSIISTEQLSDEDIASLEGKEVYLDTENNCFYFGKITEIKTAELPDGEKQVTVLIETDAQYKRGEGFSVDGNRIAVGCEYTLRYESKRFDIAVVEMYKGVKK